VYAKFNEDPSIRSKAVADRHTDMMCKYTVSSVKYGEQDKNVIIRIYSKYGHDGF
jgi:hypothetical protein